MHFKNARNASVYAVFRAFLLNPLQNSGSVLILTQNIGNCKIAFAGFYLKFILPYCICIRLLFFCFISAFLRRGPPPPQLKQRHKGRYLLWFSLPYFPLPSSAAPSPAHSKSPFSPTAHCACQSPQRRGGQLLQAGPHSAG